MTDLTEECASASHEPELGGAHFPPMRLAVSALFLMNGFVIGSWAPLIPVFADRLHLSEAPLGMMILLFGLGSLMAMPVLGGLIARFGSASVVSRVTLFLVPALLLVALAPDVPLAIPALIYFGAAAGGMDVAMNANAVVVEQRMNRAVMSSFHGFWSLGGLAGAGAGGFMIAWFGPFGYGVGVTILAAILAALALPRLARDGAMSNAATGPAIRLPMTLAPYLIGIVALFSMVPEGAVLDWGAVYLRDELGAGLALAGSGFAAFSGMMAVMRFAGDRVRNRLGAVLTLRICASLAFIGILAAGLAPNAVIAIAGFAVAGIGISNAVPIAFSAAGNLPGLAPGIGLSLATFTGYAGILVAPSLIGFAAAKVGLGAVFSALPLLLLIVLALSGIARHADRSA